jgi:hypothetical protein
MSDSEHNRVIEVLYELALDFKPYGRVYVDHISKDYKTINILSHRKRGAADVYPYYPDLWCRTKRTNKIEIFEVWDSQIEDACITDIVLAALTPDIEALYIICLQKDQYELALKLVKVVLSSLFGEEGSLLLDPSKVAKYVTYVPAGVLDDRRLKKFLHDKLDF